MPLSRANIAPKLLLMNIVKGQPMPNTLGSCIGCGQSFGMMAVAPRLPRLWANLQGAKLVEGNGWAIGCGLIYKAANHFFFDSSLGSLHSFHVFVRRSLTFLSCKIVRKVSRQIEETTFF